MALPTDYQDTTTPAGTLTELPATTSRGMNAITTQINANTTAVATKYALPGGGIPATDLAAAVQTSLGKADSAIQAVTSSTIADASTVGKTVLTAANSGAAKTALSLTATDVGLSNVTNHAQYYSGGTDVPVIDGGTGASDAATARTNLGVAYGTSGATVCVGNDARLADTRTPTDASVTDAKVSASAAIALSKLAVGHVTGSANGTPTTLTVWVGTAAQYAAIGSPDADTLYMVTP